MLYHFRSPSARQTLDTAVFGYDYSVLSKLFNASVQYVHDHHSDKFRNIPSIIHKLPVFNAAIIAKIVDSFPGTAIPADAVHCSLFADNCRFEIARPTGPYHVQQAYYSGHKHIHNLGFQCVQGPDGIIYDIYDAPVGRHQDRWYMAQSGVNAQLSLLQQGNDIQYWQYTDKGYNEDTHTHTAAHGPGPVT